MNRGPGVLGRPRTPGGASYPPHTPALAGHPRQPQAIAERRAFRKATCPGSAPRPRVNAPAAMQEGGADARKVFEGDRAAYILLASAREARRTASPPASTTHHGSHSPFVGDTPSRAGPRLPVPSAGVDSARVKHNRQQRRAPQAVFEPPWLIRKTRKGELKHARSKRKNKGKKKQKKKKNKINKKKKKGGQNGKVNACTPVSCSLQEPLAVARDLAGVSQDRPLEPLACPNKP